MISRHDGGGAEREAIVSGEHAENGTACSAQPSALIVRARCLFNCTRYITRAPPTSPPPTGQLAPARWVHSCPAIASAGLPKPRESGGAGLLARCSSAVLELSPQTHPTGCAPLAADPPARPCIGIRLTFLSPPFPAVPVRCPTIIKERHQACQLTSHASMARSRTTTARTRPEPAAGARTVGWVPAHPLQSHCKPPGRPGQPHAPLCPLLPHRQQPAWRCS